MKKFKQFKEKVTDELARLKVEEMQTDHKVKKSMDDIVTFRKKACTSCKRKLIKLIPTIIFGSEEKKNQRVDKFIDEKLCDKCRKLVK